MSRHRNGRNDGGLWQQATRDVKPLPSRVARAGQPPSAPERPPALKSPQTPTALPEVALKRFAGIDRASAERLKRGQHRIQARLDLHGMTQDEAHRALLSFIQAARTASKRCVLVITGRGERGGGVLKAAVPRWLEEPSFRPHLLAIAAAQPRHGGAGALYVMLRRSTTDSDR